MARRTTPPYDTTQDRGTVLDILYKYADICAREFCGRCMPCRYGTKEWTFIIQKLIDGKGTLQDLEQLKVINQSMKTASFCRLGQVAPFVIESILNNRNQEITEYITEGIPLHNNITGLPEYIIHPELCDGCPSDEKAPCQKVCTVNAIKGDPSSLHSIDLGKCFRCDECVAVCPTFAIYFS